VPVMGLPGVGVPGAGAPGTPPGFPTPPRALGPNGKPKEPDL